MSHIDKSKKCNYFLSIVLVAMLVYSLFISPVSASSSGDWVERGDAPFLVDTVRQ